MTKFFNFFISLTKTHPTLIFCIQCNVYGNHKITFTLFTLCDKKFVCSLRLEFFSVIDHIQSLWIKRSTFRKGIKECEQYFVIMASHSVDFLFSHYVDWVFSVNELVVTINFIVFSTNFNTFFSPANRPMTLEYQKHMHYVTVKVPADFITTDVCNECDEDGPHITPDHIFRIILTHAMDDTIEMRMFNDHNNDCVIPSDSDAYLPLEALVFGYGNECYFYGKVDEDDRSTLYININKLPTQ